jgi:hypothetical protein
MSPTIKVCPRDGAAAVVRRTSLILTMSWDQ